MRRILLLFLLSYIVNANDMNEHSWRGHILRLGMGGTFDLELSLKNPIPDPKGDGHPSSAMIKWGYEYAYQFHDSPLLLSFALDWTITYPRNFYAHGFYHGLLNPPVSLWYTPMTNAQIGYAFNERWLATVGLIYYWGISNSLRYRPVKHFFFETASIVWLDRIFNTGGFYGGGFDNLHLTMGFGYML